MPIESVNGIDLYYEIGGTGEQVLFISGSGGDLRNRPNQFDSPLAESFEIICYDQRGLGQTANPDGPFTMAEYADDAAGVCDNHRICRAGSAHGASDRRSDSERQCGKKSAAGAGMEN